jgi:polysaccharide deacetylase 2 family uncharacterized protein YibQ
LSFWKRITGRGRRRTGARRRPRRKARRRAVDSRAATWVLGALVVLLAALGVLKWSETRQGQAALLTMGSEQMYDDVQDAVDGVLAQALPAYRPGPLPAAVDAADRPLDQDWQPPHGEGLVRCRAIPVATSESFWELQRRLDDDLRAVGARVLWGERLHEPVRGGARPDDRSDALRLDLGVRGRPTHVVVLYREGELPALQWGVAAEETAWRRLAGQTGPVVALVIDDWGYSRSDAAERISELPAPLTMAVLPGLAYSRHYANQATELAVPSGDPSLAAALPDLADAAALRDAAGCGIAVSWASDRPTAPQARREIILHLPMQPQGYPDPDPGPRAVLVGMERTDIANLVDEALTQLVKATGVNNHMGSAATADRPTMEALMGVLGERNLLFVDSLTSPASVAYEEARKAGLRTARNRIFLDYDNENPETIAANLAVLVRTARAQGFAVGIGHPHAATADVLQRELPRLLQEGVRFVTISELLALRALTEREDG